MRFPKTIRASLTIGLMFAALTSFASVNIFVQPQNQTVPIGSNAVFTASTTTTSGETITAYTWLTSTNASGPFSTVSGATGPVLTISNAQISNSGFYFVRVNYQSGGSPGIAVSTAVTLSVQDLARITGQPTGLTRAVGAAASFTVTAAGETPLGFQWRFNGTNLANGGRISGANSSGLAISSLTTNDVGNYDVIVTNSYSSVTSQVAVLTILTPPVITIQPGNQMAPVGSTVSFSAAASGSAPLSFRWKKGGVNLSNSGRISGATSSELVITGALTNDTGLYSVLITNAVGSTSSVSATLTIFNPPILTSPTNVSGQQGVPFSFNLTATGSAPITFSSETLPNGLSLNPTNGVISGIPSVSGVFPVNVFASNAGSNTTATVTFTITSGVPQIISPLVVQAQQGQPFSYTIIASNNPASFSASGLPHGLNFNPSTGVISGSPIESGFFFLPISVSNPYGVDSQILILNLASSVPVITSGLVANGTENQANFTYTIRATPTNWPTLFGATGLPLGLTVDTNTGVISGTPAVGGTNNVVIFARNIWGVGTNNLQIRIANAPIADLFITDVTWTYSKPYLLDFTFSLRDNPNPAQGRAIARPVNQLQIVCKEGNTNQEIFTPIGNETAFVISPAVSANAKQLKTFLVMDYTYSMFIASNAIAEMESSVKGLIDQQPPSAHFAVNEFHADFVTPALVIDFTSDKVRLHQAIDGIQTNFVKGNHAGSRLYDALNAAVAAFGPPNNDEQRYIVVTSDGHDDASIAILEPVLNAASSALVKIYCVGFGTNVNTAVLQQIATQTGGRYFSAANAGQLPAQFALLLKDLNAQYFLRWATLQRAGSFQPSFDVTVEGITASYNSFWPTNVEVIDTTQDPPVTNIVVYKTDTNTTPPTMYLATDFAPDFVPNSFSNNVQVGELRLVPDSATNASAVTLRAFYVPRFVREFKLRYRANYPCTPVLLSNGPGEILSGWTLALTNEGVGTNLLTLSSPDPTNALTSLPYGIRGDLVKFQFQPQAVTNPKHAFSFFAIDNSIYTNFPPSGQSFTLTNTNSVITVFAATPPLGTPIPWLLANGFTTNFADAEITDPNGNGLLVWQEYLAGLNPNDPNSTLAISVISTGEPGVPNEITFSTVLGKKYRVEAAVHLGDWINLIDEIPGTGGELTVFDHRPLGGVSTMYYRIAVY